jgi:uncharacterized protein DUF4389
VKWFLAIPHWIVLFVLYIGAFFAWIGSWWAVLITGHYPRGIFDLLVGVHRWTINVTAYTLLMVDPYPLFSLEQEPDYPIHFDIDYPDAGIARWRGRSCTGCS